MTTTTLSLESLTAYLESLGVPASFPTFPAADPFHNPNDIYRSYIAAALESILDCDRGLIYESLQRTTTPSKGDLVLVLPRLRLKNVKPKELGPDLASKVTNRLHIFFCFPALGGNMDHLGRQSAPCINTC
jgi:arginyl-tRNA synthetase